MKRLALLLWLASVGTGWAACSPSNAPFGSAGCQTIVPSMAPATDTVTIWRPGSFPGSATQILPGNLSATANGFTVSMSTMLGWLTGTATGHPLSVGALTASVTASGQTTIRPLANWFGDTINAKGFGAVLNGTTDDSTAINAARAAAGTNGTVFVPPGGWNASTPTAGTASGGIIWQMSGNTFGTGTTQVGGIADDVTINNLGGPWFSRQSTTGLHAATLRVDGRFANFVNSPGSVSGAVANTLWVKSSAITPPTSTSYAANYVWGFLSQMDDAHIGPAQNVSAAFDISRPVTALSDGFGQRGPIWASFFQARDLTGKSSDLSGTLIGAELNIAANDDDPGPSGDGGDRLAWHIGASTPTTTAVPGRIGRGLEFSDDGKSFFGTIIGIRSRWDTAGIDTSKGGPLTATITTTTAQGAAGITIPMPYTSGVTVGGTITGTNIPANDTVVSKTPTSVTLAATTTGAVASGTVLTFGSFAPAIHLGSNQRICFDTAAARCMQWNASGAVWQFLSNNIAVMAITTGGALSGSTVTVTPASSATPGLAVVGTANAGLDTTGATLTNAAVKMASGQKIWFEPTGVRTISYDGGTGKLFYAVGGVNVFSVDASGNVKAAGTITGSTTP